MKKLLSLDIKYSFGQVFYFGAFASMMGYASVFLLYKECSNATIGIVLSLCNILAVFIQPMLANYIDNHEEKSMQKVIQVLVLVVIILSALLYFIPSGIAVLALVTAVFAIMSSIMPLMNSLAFIFEKYGYTVNYGLARGLGSVAYAVTSMILGYAVEMYNPDVLPLFYVGFNVMLFVVLQLYVLPKTKQVLVEKEESEEEQIEEEGVSFIQFLMKYKKFMLFLLGFILVYFAHTVINNFFIQVINNVGGGSSDMGNAVFLAAMLELPTMALFTKINTKINVSTLIKLSIICFLIKHAITYVATDMTMIFVAQVFQMAAYALFIPASVYYVNKLFNASDLVKGQSLVTMSMTLSSFAASLVGGVLLDVIGVSQVLLISVVLSVIGAAIVCLTVQKV